MSSGTKIKIKPIKCALSFSMRAWSKSLVNSHFMFAFKHVMFIFKGLDPWLLLRCKNYKNLVAAIWKTSFPRFQIAGVQFLCNAENIWGSEPPAPSPAYLPIFDCCILVPENLDTKQVKPFLRESLGKVQLMWKYKQRHPLLIPCMKILSWCNL